MASSLQAMQMCNASRAEREGYALGVKIEAEIFPKLWNDFGSCEADKLYEFLRSVAIETYLKALWPTTSHYLYCRNVALMQERDKNIVHTLNKCKADDPAEKRK